MKKTNSILLAGLLILLTFGLNTLKKCVRTATTAHGKTGLILIEYAHDTILFDPTTNCAAWCKWKLSPGRLKAGKKVSRDKYKFSPEKNLPRTSQVVSSDYTGSGYDRGHLCPAADNEFSVVAMKECMILTNICPQTPELNRGIWETLESHTRNIAKSGKGDLYVVAGPLEFTDTWIGKGDRLIRVPSKFFKVMCNPTERRGVGYIMENTKNPGTDPSWCTCSIDSIESLTGFDFFDWIQDDIENAIECKKKY